MTGRSVPVVLIPRFTAFVGAGSYYLDPIPVAAYASLRLGFWEGVLTGTLPVVGVGFEESNDLSTWAVCAGGPFPSPVPYTEVPYEPRFTSAWFRMLVYLAGTDPGVTCWARGFFELREK